MDQFSIQTRSFPQSGPFFPRCLMPSARCMVVLIWTWLLPEQTPSLLYACLWLQTLWHGSKMLFSIPGIISVPEVSPHLRQVLSRVIILQISSCSWYFHSGLRKSGLQTCWVFWWKNLLSSPCCGIIWSNCMSGSFTDVWRHCDFTCGSCQVTSAS